MSYNLYSKGDDYDELGRDSPEKLMQPETEQKDFNLAYGSYIETEDPKPIN